jgi:hypothetical protein
MLLLRESLECGQAKRLFVLYQPVYNQLVGGGWQARFTINRQAFCQVAAEFENLPPGRQQVDVDPVEIIIGVISGESWDS